MRRLLVIAWYFPPMGGGGVQRTLSFVRHLSARGWQITVLTTADPGRYWAEDRTLLARVPQGVEVLRVSDRPLDLARRALRRAAPARFRRDLDRLLELPDRQATWWPFARRAAERRMAAGGFDAIYSTSAPWTDHLVARGIARAHGLRWVADFRDPWTLNQTFAPASPLHAAWARRQEQSILRSADVVLANTEQNAAELRRAFGGGGAQVEALPNGWEADETEGLPPPSDTEPLTLGYAGSFYAGYQPDRLFAALRGALDAEPDLRGRLRVVLAGKTEQAAAIAAAGLSGVVQERGYLPQRAALELLSSSHATLLVLPEHADSGWVPQKLYVYLRLGRPIVAVIPRGEARRILEAAGGRHLVLDPHDPDPGPRLARFLADLSQVRTGPAGFRPEIVARYDRARLATRLDALLRGSPVAPAAPVV